jgi:MOSC domain-containing protein YiiM
MPPTADAPRILALARNEIYGFSKTRRRSLQLLEGLGALGDVHSGQTVKHRSRVAVDPTQPNLRQIHLIQSELFTELAEKGFEIEPGALGENVTTQGIDLLALPTGTVLELGPEARIELTGLRNPCGQINAYRNGLLALVRGRDDAGGVIRRAGVMAIVTAGGRVEVGDAIRVRLPSEPHRMLECV